MARGLALTARPSTDSAIARPVRSVMAPRGATSVVATRRCFSAVAAYAVPDTACSCTRRPASTISSASRKTSPPRSRVPWLPSGRPDRAGRAALGARGGASAGRVRARGGSGPAGRGRRRLRGRPATGAAPARAWARRSGCGAGPRTARPRPACGSPAPLRRAAVARLPRASGAGRCGRAGRRGAGSRERASAGAGLRRAAGTGRRARAAGGRGRHSSAGLLSASVLVGGAADVLSGVPSVGASAVVPSAVAPVSSAAPCSAADGAAPPWPSVEVLSAAPSASPRRGGAAARAPGVGAARDDPLGGVRARRLPTVSSGRVSWPPRRSGAGRGPSPCPTRRAGGSVPAGAIAVPDVGRRPDGAGAPATTGVGGTVRPLVLRLAGPRSGAAAATGPGWACRAPCRRTAAGTPAGRRAPSRAPRRVPASASGACSASTSWRSTCSWSASTLPWRLQRVQLEAVLRERGVEGEQAQQAQRAAGRRRRRRTARGPPGPGPAGRAAARRCGAGPRPAATSRPGSPVGWSPADVPAARAAAVAAAGPRRRRGRRSGRWRRSCRVPLALGGPQPDGRGPRVGGDLLGARLLGAAHEQAQLGRAALGHEGQVDGHGRGGTCRRARPSRPCPPGTGRRGRRCALRRRARRAIAAGTARRSTPSSSLTSMRSAWNVRLAGWPPVRRVAAGMALRTSSARRAVLGRTARGRGRARSRRRSARRSAPRRTPAAPGRGPARRSR